MSAVIEKSNNLFLYQQVINLIREMQQDGLIGPGEKLPSLRNLAEKLSVSVPTVKQAYLELEFQGIITARPQSGYYLKSVESNLSAPKKSSFPRKPVAVSRQELIEHVYSAIHQPRNLSFGVANPIAALPPTKAINRAMRRVLSVAGDKALNYGPMQGYEPLRRQLAMRYLDYGLHLSPEEFVVTNGAQEAISICLQTVAKPGDVIAVESPCYFGVLELIESLGMLALEIPLCADNSLCLEDVKKAVSNHDVRACVFSATIANPMGCILSDDKKADLVAFLESKNIALIEDDVYGDLYFTKQRGALAQKFSTKGLVLTCSSFSKTAAPSYRVGWVATPGYADKATKLKRAISCSSSLMNQWVMTEFLRSGEYDRYVKQLRQKLLTNKERMLGLICRYFHPDVRVADPKGGTVLWLALPREFDGNEIFRRALEQNISISPGSLFSPTNRYQNCIRLSYGLPWSEEIEQGIKTLSDICR